MYKKILVALDLSSVSEKVFEKALSIAKLCQADLMFIHVLSHDEAESPLAQGMMSLNYYEMIELETLKSYQQQWQKYVKRGVETLKNYCDQATEARLNSEYSQQTGQAGRQICQAAQDWNADLIIIGHRGLSGLSEFVLGSVSNYVLHHAPCSILIEQLSVQNS
ncbi:MAG: universal stress protein [Cyanobacteriota bacterium]|nr:universal stress protein [Cyanobacteriota bacterium]